MIREECIGLLKRYAEYNGMGIPNLAGCREAMRMAVELLEKPSLPSDLDEACQQISKDCYDGFYSGYEESHRIAARMGAEWMAGQGVTKEAVIGMATEEISINVSQQILDELDLCPGDKVVVQIRKK